MSSECSASSSREDRVNEAIAAYIEAAEKGQALDQAAFLAGHPDISDELKSFLQNQAQFDLHLLAAATDQPNQTENRHCASSDPTPVNAPTHTFQRRGVPSPRDVIRYFGDYELLDEIARGGMGIVFKARQVKLNRIVAVKMILAGSFAGPEDIERFHTEAEAAAQLDHPGIVPIYEVGQHEGQHYFSMGFVEGQSLAKKVAEGPLPPREAAEIVRAVAEAVQYAHDKGVIHRDLKPGNILLDQTGKPRVSDFGLAKLTESGSDLTGTGQILGTPSYMPPEQAAAHVSAVGRLSDVYSLGAILYCLLTGRPPFQAASPLETLLQVQNQDPVAPRQFNSAIPLDLNTISLKCLEKDPARRYKSARNVADELRRHLAGEPILARPISSIERGWRWCRRRPLMPSVVAAVLVVSVTAALVFRHLEAIARQQSLQRELVTAVDAIQNARGLVVPFTIRDLKKFPPELAMAELNTRYDSVALNAQSEPAESHKKLGLAYARAAYGAVDIAYLCSQIKTASTDEVDNFASAFGNAREPSMEGLQFSAVAATHTQDWRFKARLATVALYLEDATIAADMCQIVDRPDPVQRTIFIDEFPAWRNDLARLLPPCKATSDAALRSAICMGVGSIPAQRLAAADVDAWKAVLANWYQAATENVTHSAAGWALRQWNAELPNLVVSHRPDPARDWFVNSQRMTLLKIRPGKFKARWQVIDPIDTTMKEVTKLVTLTTDFYLSDREVSRGQFQHFMDDPECPVAEKATLYSPSGAQWSSHPQTHVKWYDAVLFCNWLSRREGFVPCYERTGKKEQGTRVDTQSLEFDTWRLASNGTGYRLPTESEWEYACRAGTATSYSSGEDVDLLRKYAVFSTGNARGSTPCGSRLPNGWGLFDMHDNESEWCYDLYGGTDETRDPAGPLEQPYEIAPFRVLRSGNWASEAFYCQSAWRFSFEPDTTGSSMGFRVALGSPAHLMHSAQANRVVELQPVTEEDLRSNIPTSFTFELDQRISDPEPGARVWTRIDDTIFVERLPSGKENRSQVVGRMPVAGAAGTIVERIGFKKLQVFIPDINSEDKDIKFRLTDKPDQWTVLGTIENFE